MDFAIRIVRLCRFLRAEKREYEISAQLIRSGTAIGALQREAEYAESMADFIHKFAIAQKECNETLYWLELLYKTDVLTQDLYDSFNNDARLLMGLITKSIKTAKRAGSITPNTPITPNTSNTPITPITPITSNTPNTSSHENK